MAWLRYFYWVVFLAELDWLVGPVEILCSGWRRSYRQIYLSIYDFLLFLLLWYKLDHYSNVPFGRDISSIVLIIRVMLSLGWRGSVGWQQRRRWCVVCYWPRVPAYP
jgi:hypothetical protein